MSQHDRDLASAFDRQAERFERAGVQRDPASLARLVQFAALPSDGHVLDCGCGPGLVAEAFLEAGCRVSGVDLSAEMIRRARVRCARFGDRARFEQRSVFDPELGDGFDAALSRSVLHHVTDPLAFVRRQVERVARGGVVVASDHTSDPDPQSARWHERIERARDRTHTRTLSPGELVDLFVRAGLREIAHVESPFELDFDEWFDRGTPVEAKETLRRVLLGGSARGFKPVLREDGGVTIVCWRSLVRGVK